MKKSIFIYYILFFLFSFTIKSQVYTKGFIYNQFLDASSGGGGVTLKIENNILSISYNFGVSSCPLRLGKVLNFSDYTGTISNTEIPTAGTYFQDKGYRFFVIGKDIAIYPVAPQQLNGSISGTLSVNLANSSTIPSDILSFFATNYTYDNKIISTDYLDETQTLKKSSITYFDGLGREKQHVQIGATPLGKDLVTHVEYDGFGRQAKEFLPFPSASSTGALVSGAATATNTFYSSSTAKATENDTFPFSEKEFDGSPLNRVLKQAAPGNSWKLGSNNEIKLEHQTNTATEVRRFLVTLSFDATNKIYNPTLTENGTYPAGSLYKTITKDENWKANQTNLNDNTTEEFKNKEGQTVLKRTYNNNQKHDTYYVYDDYGNQTYVIPPKLADETTTSTLISKLNDLAYQYKYDHRNRQIEKKLPGKTTEFMVYDKLNRLVMTGPALAPFSDLNTQGWLVTKYDRFNRPVLTAWRQDVVTPARRNELQATYNAATVLNESKLTTNTTFSAVTHRYSNVAFPTTNYNILSVNYYDDYNFPSAFARPTAIEGQNTRTQLTGMPTGSWVRVLEHSTNSIKGETTTLFYDNKARNIGTYLQNYLGGFTYTTQKLDFRGKPEYTFTKHKRLTTSTELVVKESFEYDAQERLKKHTHQINGASVETLVQNEYDELGQLKTKHVGGVQTSETGTGALQKLDYLYNIRGWLRKLNEPAVLGSDLFSYELKYNTALSSGVPTAVKPLFNGNITEASWKTSSDNQLRNYFYQYDALNRLKSASSKAGMNIGGYNENGITYDKNGNILTLNRTGINPFSNLNTDIDGLSYRYDTGNKLLSVTDAQLKNEGFTEAENQTGDDYTYDSFGNMMTDANKNITSIKYNHLNLPREIIVGNDALISNKKLTNTYKADGEKIRKNVDYFDATYAGWDEEYTGHQSNSSTDYLGGFIYENNNLQMIPTTEGYVKMNYFVNPPRFEYVYQHKDHVENTRLVYSDSNKNGIVEQSEIMEETHYYPFGLAHKGYGKTIPNFSYSKGAGRPITETYKTFQGQQFTDDFNLNLHSWKYRTSDPTTGRFWQIDPLSEKYVYNGVYNFSENRVVDGRELEGLEWENFMLGFKNPGELKEKYPNPKESQLQQFSTTVENPTKSFEQFKNDFVKAPEDFLSNSKATFHHPVDKEGNKSETKEGNFIKIDIQGPMNNSIVKIIDLDNNKNSLSAKFVTMEGHLEKGVIRFDLLQNKDKTISFKITGLSQVDMTLAPEDFSRKEQRSSWNEVLTNVSGYLGGYETKRVEKITENNKTQTKITQY